MTSRPDHTSVPGTPTTVQLGDLVGLDEGWWRVKDLRQTGEGGRAAVLDGMPGVWKLPESFTILRPVSR
ncbi:hypothetical protein [Streptomyces sp. NPDC058861]|uniref:hypothetical protein n=1 Tax=Streptomyces sp. NPDC058861 TaxID=3346653 RepID=UPI0036935F7B